MSETSFFDKNVTWRLKGVALIFMFVHHFFTFNDRYIEGISYPELYWFWYTFSSPFKICVPVFAFMTGYFYHFAKNKNYSYSLKKILNLLITYWIVFFILLVLSLIFGQYNFSIRSFALELIALDNQVMVFCWYVSFYCISMLFLPFLAPIISRSKGSTIWYGIVIPTIFLAISSGTKWFSGEVGADIVDYLLRWFPCIILGYYCAHWKVFEEIDEKYKSCPTLVRIILWIGIAVVAFMGRYYLPLINVAEIPGASDINLNFNMDFIYAPAFVYAVVQLLKTIQCKWLDLVVSRIGHKSLTMWFISCIFFNSCREVFQPILFWMHNPILVLIWGMLLCYVCALPIEWAAEKIKKRVHCI